MNTPGRNSPGASDAFCKKNNTPLRVAQKYGQTPRGAEKHKERKKIVLYGRRAIFCFKKITAPRGKLKFFCLEKRFFYGGAFSKGEAFSEDITVFGATLALTVVGAPYYIEACFLS